MYYLCDRKFGCYDEGYNGRMFTFFLDSEGAERFLRFFNIKNFTLYANLTIFAIAFIMNSSLKFDLLWR